MRVHRTFYPSLMTFILAVAAFPALADRPTYRDADWIDMSKGQIVYVPAIHDQISNKGYLITRLFVRNTDPYQSIELAEAVLRFPQYVEDSTDFDCMESAPLTIAPHDLFTILTIECENVPLPNVTMPTFPNVPHFIVTWRSQNGHVRSPIISANHVLMNTNFDLLGISRAEGRVIGIPGDD